MSTPDRRAMLERDHPTLSIRGQCRLLGITRSGVYRPAPANDDDDLALMRRIDALFTAWPFLGSRRMTAMPRADGFTVNRKRVQRQGNRVEKLMTMHTPITAHDAIVRSATIEIRSLVIGRRQQ